MEDIVKYTVYAHTYEETMYDIAMEHGFTEDEIEQLGLAYIGYEITGHVTVNRKDRSVEVVWSD